MLSHNDSSLQPLLKEMLQCCQDIQEILKNDKDYFIKNDLASIEKSNIKKKELLEKLNFLSVNMNSRDQSKDLFERVASAAQQEVTSLAEKLKIEIAACYKSIIINSTIVFSNLQQLKEIWDKLASYNSNNNCVYDGKGGIK